MSTVTLNNVKKQYQQTSVIHDLSIKINHNEFIVIVGSSGCGKSTLLRMIAGLEEVSAGNILIDGIDVTDKAPKDRDVAMVFQNYALYPHMKVFDNIAYSLKIRKLPKSEISQRVNEIAKLLKINHLLDRKPNALSGGQRQRVAMGRAIIRNPKLFLFDEPLSNLDASLRIDMRLEIKRLQQKLGVTSLYVTHDQVEAMTMADRIVVMNQGSIDQIATAEEIYKRPATLFVAGFMGAPSMNFLSATVTEGSVELTDGRRLPINIFANNDMKITLGVRPEHLKLSEKASNLDMVMEVDMIEHLGAETLLYGHVHNSKERITVKVNGYWQGTIGQDINLFVDYKHLHAFNPKSEQRLEIAPQLSQ